MNILQNPRQNKINLETCKNDGLTFEPLVFANQKTLKQEESQFQNACIYKLFNH
jgi:hypothetical protein